MYFVFLEFLEPQVETTLRALRDALQPWKRSKSPIHVTVRGPYRTEPNYVHLSDLAERITGQGVRLLGAGYFSNGKKLSVFLRAESAVFKEVWWKPDFRTSVLDIQPHVTLFESEDRDSAMLALNFLRASRISIYTTAVQLSVYSSKAPELFGTRPIVNTRLRASYPREIVAIDEDVIERARELGELLHKRKKDLRVRQNGET